jgi:hypothetical protein
MTAQWLSERLGQQFIVENRTGAATNIATGVIRSAPDGYRLLMSSAANTITMMADVNLLHVPYRVGPLTDLIAGQVQVYFGPDAFIDRTHKRCAACERWR